MRMIKSNELKRHLYSIAITEGRMMRKNRRFNEYQNKPVATFNDADVPFVSCLAVIIGGDFKAMVRRAI